MHFSFKIFTLTHQLNLKGEWINSSIDCARQTDGFNCGVFLLLFALCIAADRPTTGVPTDEEFLVHARTQLGSCIADYRAGNGPTIDDILRRVFD